MKACNRLEAGVFIGQPGDKIGLVLTSSVSSSESR